MMSHKVDNVYYVTSGAFFITAIEDFFYRFFFSIFIFFKIKQSGYIR